ncbi:hypothetical protein ACI3EY_16675 [Ornithinimicrobium sp. LYQ92]|uniref:hypothetical protein n=1 Tax=Serinicoccus sp. LYQ92 TaxID=3378798 RepID=UPI0038528C90
MNTTYITADLAASWLRVSRRTVHRWAKRDGWSTRGRNRHTQYLLDDVSRTYETEHTQLLQEK